MLALYPASPVESTSWEKTRRHTSAEGTPDLRLLYLAIGKVTWTEQSIGRVPFCSCHRGPSAMHPAPAHQYSHYRPGERGHKRSPKTSTQSGKVWNSMIRSFANSSVSVNVSASVAERLSRWEKWTFRWVWGENTQNVQFSLIYTHLLYICTMFKSVWTC